MKRSRFLPSVEQLPSTIAQYNCQVELPNTIAKYKTRRRGTKWYSILLKIDTNLIRSGGRMAEWFRLLDFNAVTRVQILLWPLADVVLGACLVQLLGYPCK